MAQRGMDFMDSKTRASCGSTDIDIFNVTFGVKGIGHFFDDTLFMYAGIGPDLGLVFVENKKKCCRSCGTKKSIDLGLQQVSS